jgi:hypothetical protein
MTRWPPSIWRSRSRTNDGPEQRRQATAKRVGGLLKLFAPHADPLLRDGTTLGQGEEYGTMRGTRVAVVAVISAAVVGFGVTAFALDGTGTGDSTTTSDVVAEVPTTVAPDPGTIDPVTDAPTGDGTTTPVSTVDCPEGTTFANHGAYVSSVARTPGRAPGDVVDAAHSECGKPLAADGATDPTAAPDDGDPSAATDTDSTSVSGPPAGGPAGGRPASPGNRGAAGGHSG